jgi:hypothetical protein
VEKKLEWRKRKQKREERLQKAKAKKEAKREAGEEVSDDEDEKERKKYEAMTAEERQKMDEMKGESSETLRFIGNQLELQEGRPREKLPKPKIGLLRKKLPRTISYFTPTMPKSTKRFIFGEETVCSCVKRSNLQ